MVFILGIETSCDETSVAIVNDEKKILAHEIFSQIHDHRPYGGVVPEIAARGHLCYLEGLILSALDQSKMNLSQIDAIAATLGPGLIGGLLVGAMTGKTLACALNKPFIGINHLQGHALSVRLVHHVPFPYLLLLVSGGHCQFIHVKDVCHYEILGTTMDDAVGEAFDKTAKILGLDYPGGPELEKLARQGNDSAFDLPRPLKGRKGCDFSFSGLKTAVRIQAQSCGDQLFHHRADLAASFQRAVCDVLVNRCENAMDMFKSSGQTSPRFVLAGGVAANTLIRQCLYDLACEKGFELFAPPLDLCTDNGAMIAWAGMERFMQNHCINDIALKPRPRWPLDQLVL